MTGKTPFILHQLYDRSEVAAMLGQTYNWATWDQGIVRHAGHVILFVTKEKARMPVRHRYKDRFVDPQTLVWESQRENLQASKVGREVLHPGTNPVVLFMRRQKMDGKKAMKYHYLGTLQRLYHHGQKPFTVVWRLTPELPQALQRLYLEGPPD